MAKVSIYTRQNRAFVLAHPKEIYKPGTIFILRYTRGGKRVWETLDVPGYGQAFTAARMREVELFKEKPVPLASLHTAPPRPEAPRPRVAGDSLDQANTAELD